MFFAVILRKITVLQLSMLFVCFGYIVITINFFRLFTHCSWRFRVISAIFRGFDKFPLAWHVSELYHFFFWFIAAFFDFFHIFDGFYSLTWFFLSILPVSLCILHDFIVYFMNFILYYTNFIVYFTSISCSIYINLIFAHLYFMFL